MRHSTCPNVTPAHAHLGIIARQLLRHAVDARPQLRQLRVLLPDLSIPLHQLALQRACRMGRGRPRPQLEM